MEKKVGRVNIYKSTKLIVMTQIKKKLCVAPALAREDDMKNCCTVSGAT